MASLPNPRRSFSLPVHQHDANAINRSRSSTGRIDGESEDNIELLFSHNQARIVHFTASRSAGGRERGRLEALPYRNHSERTLATGPLRVYRVKFQCAFISSGAILHPLLPKSAAWCVDEENAIFVLRIRQNQYWRLELLQAEFASILVSELKDVLDHVCFFERVPCPFRILQIAEFEAEAPLPVFSKRQFSANRAAQKKMESDSLPSSVASSVDEQLFPLYMGDEPPSSTTTTATRRRTVTQEPRESDDVHTPLETYKLYRRESIVSAHISTFESIRATAAKEAAGSNPSSYGSSVNSSFKLVHGFEPKSYTGGDRFLVTNRENKFPSGGLKPRAGSNDPKMLGSSAPTTIQTGRRSVSDTVLKIDSSAGDDVFGRGGKPTAKAPEPKSKVQVSKVQVPANDAPVFGKKLPTLQTKVGESSISAGLKSPVRQSTPTKRRAVDLFNVSRSPAAPAVTTRDNVQNYVTSSPAAAICFGLKSPDRNSISTPRSGVIRIPKRKETLPIPVMRPNFDISPDMSGDIDDYSRDDNKFLGGPLKVNRITDDDADSTQSLSDMESDSESEDWSHVMQPVTESPTKLRRRRAGTTGSVVLPSDSDSVPASQPEAVARKSEDTKHHDALILPRDANASRLTLSNLAHRATAILLNKTLDLAFMRPSSYVAAMMLRIAARVAAGTVVSAYYWTDWTNQEEEDFATIDPIDDDEYEDDFGVKLVGKRKGRFPDDDERCAQGVRWSSRGRRGSSGRIPG